MKLYEYLLYAYCAIDFHMASSPLKRYGTNDKKTVSLYEKGRKSRGYNK